jgi:hypothetical protein
MIAFLGAAFAYMSGGGFSRGGRVKPSPPKNLRKTNMGYVAVGQTAVFGFAVAATIHGSAQSRKILLLAGAGLVLGLGAPSVEAGSILDRDAATDRPSPGAASSSGAAKPTGFWFLPGFVQPYGYPLPAYADGTQTIHTGR